MIYIASDMHLGVPDRASSLEREKLLVRWLEHCRQDATEIILLGDVFDFWFEYRHAIPKGYTRLLGKLAEIADSGIPITVFAGNHDMWYRDYLTQELGVRVIMHQEERSFFGKQYYLHHGDGKGPGDRGYKLMKWGMRSRLLQWCFRWMHPDWGIGLANHFSKTSRNAHKMLDDVDHGDKEFLVQYVSKQVSEHDRFDFYVFGHRHKAREQTFGGRGTLLVLGDWISAFSYLRISDSGPEFLTFRHGEPEPDIQVIRVAQNRPAADGAGADQPAVLAVEGR